MSARLIGRTGPTAGQDYTLMDVATIGASSENEIRIAAPGVSRRHARVVKEKDQYFLEDAGAINGTFLNGGRVTREALRHLDVVTLGRAVDLIFIRRDGDTRPPSVDPITAAQLTVMDGAEAGTVVEVPKGELTLGRAVSCNVALASGLISKVHARVQRTASQVVLQDLQSINGTFVNGGRVDSVVVLKDGDTINLAGVRTLKVAIEGSAASKPTTPAAIAADEPAFNQEWKTRFVWAPEELALIEQARAEAMQLAALRAPAPAAAVASKPAAKPPVAKPAEPAPKPAAAAPKPQAAAAAPKPSDAQPPEAGAPAPPAPPKAAPPPPVKPQEMAPPAAVRPAGPAQAAIQKAEAPIKPGSPVPVAPDVASAPSPAPPAAAAVPPKPPAAAQQAPAAVVPPKPPPITPPAKAEPHADDAMTVDAVPAPRLRGVRLVGGGVPISLGLGSFVIGRAVGSDVRLDDRQVSRSHARIVVEPLGASIEDLQTVNGTLVNGKEVKTRQVLHGGDKVQIGAAEFRVELVT